MNFLKKKLKPLASSFSSAATHSQANNSKNLEDDLYDEYVIEAPPHPSELIALGVDPAQIDVNDPDKLRELYQRAKQEGKDKATNSVLLAKQRQKEEIEEKKRTREEWKFFDNLTSRVEQVVKDSQKTLEQLKDKSAIKKLDEPEYELRQTADEVFCPARTVKQEKGANEWVAFGDSLDSDSLGDKAQASAEHDDELDHFGCPKRKVSVASSAGGQVVAELLEDCGIDLRSEQQRRAHELKQKQLAREQAERDQAAAAAAAAAASAQKPTDNKSRRSSVDIKAAARPRPRPGATPATAKDSQTVVKERDSVTTTNLPAATELDPFDTSFLANELPEQLQQQPASNSDESQKVVDPFDTSYVNF